MATSDMDKGQSLLEREERALAEKRTALRAAGAALDALRKADSDTRSAFTRLRELGFGQRDLTQSFSLSRAEALALFPRKPRKGNDGSVDDPAPADAAHERGQSVEASAN